jgi:dihydroflavonol-4-reductase
MKLERGDRVLVTGANGFVGSALTRVLLGDGQQVVALLEPGAEARNLDGLDVERQSGDIRDAASIRRAVNRCRAVFHVAGLYRFWARDPGDFYSINVEGTRNVLEAARAAGTERLVFTSTVGTLGVHDNQDGAGVDETSYPDLRHLFGSYKRSKYVAEHEVLRAAAEGLPVSVVLPTFPLGPRDTAPTPTGRLVLDFLNGRMPGYVDTVLNVVHVDDVARGHVLALEGGGVGRSYILGGDNLTLERLLGLLAERSGLPDPPLRVPRAVSLAVAWCSETVEGRMLRRPPAVPLEAARMSATRMAFDDTRARRELGYSSRPAIEAIEASARWFLEGGYVKGRRVARVARARGAIRFAQPFGQNGHQHR